MGLNTIYDKFRDEEHREEYIREHAGEHEVIINYVSQLQRMVEEAADALYRIDNFAVINNPRIRSWYNDVLSLWSGEEPFWIRAHYGSAVEEYVNMRILAGNPAIMNGYNVRCQVAHGHTRPDIVISRNDGEEIAWLDITNEGSIGHVFRKPGDWRKGRDFIAELLYPDFRAARISREHSSIASHAAANLAVRQRNMRMKADKRHLVKEINMVLGDFERRPYQKRRRTSKAEFGQCIERHFAAKFNQCDKHRIIKSMLQIYLNCHEEGYDVFHVADARDYLNTMYREDRQSMEAAWAYVEKSRGI